jgi:hypothetical protein
LRQWFVTKWQVVYFYVSLHRLTEWPVSFQNRQAGKTIYYVAKNRTIHPFVSLASIGTSSCIYRIYDMARIEA